METIIEKTLTNLVLKTSEHFNLSFEDALEAVSQSKVANDLVEFGDIGNRTPDELCQDLFYEVSKGY